MIMSQTICYLALRAAAVCLVLKWNLESFQNCSSIILLPFFYIYIYTLLSQN